MSDKKLHLKYRPKSFSEIIGQGGIVKILARSLLDVETKVEQSAVFYGPWGSGKTTLARIYARSILCQNRRDNGDPCNECDSCKQFFDGTHSGYTEIDGANITKIDDFRRILDSTAYQAVGSKYRVYVIDECHMMSKSSQNLFLKPLEEGVDNVYWFFCTTEYNKIINTIRSRCVDYRIRPIDHNDIVGRVMEICDQESIPYEPEAIEALVAAKHGHFRDVLVFVGKIRDMGGVTTEVIYDYLDIGINDLYFDVLTHLKDDPNKALSLVDRALTRVSPADTYNGVVSAAMDVYKLDKGLRGTLVVRDKDVVEKAQASLNGEAAHVVQYLVDRGSRYLDTNHLMSSMLLLRERMISGLVGTGDAKVVIREVVRDSSTQSKLTTNGVKAKKSRQPRLTDLDDKARKPQKGRAVEQIAVNTNHDDRDNTILTDRGMQMLFQKGFR